MSRVVGRCALRLCLVLAALCTGACGGGKRAARVPDTAPDAAADAAPRKTREAGVREAGARDAQGTPAPRVDAGVAADQAWLLDPEIWKPIPESLSAECPLFAGEPGKLRFPPLAWNRDPDGYEIADVVQGYGLKSRYLPEAVSVYFPKVETLFEDAQGYLISWSAIGNSTLSLSRLIRLDDGVTVAALLDRVLDPSTYCAQMPYWDARVGLSGKARDGSGEPIRLAARANANGTWTYSYPIVPNSKWPLALSFACLNTPAGELIGVGLGNVTVSPNASSSDWTAAEQPSSGDGRTLTAQGDLAVWTDPAADGNVRIRGWAPDGQGVRTLIDSLEDETVVLGVSPTHLVGIAPETPFTLDEHDTFDDGYLWVSPRTHTLLSPSALRRSPTFKVGQGDINPLKAWGDYAAGLVFPTTSSATRTGPPFLIVIQLSTWRMWRVEGHAGFSIYNDAFTLTPKYLYFGEYPVPPPRDPSVNAGDTSSLTRMLRVSWDDLPKVAVEVTP